MEKKETFSFLPKLSRSSQDQIAFTSHPLAIMGALKTHEAFHDNNVIEFHVKSSFINEEYQGHDLLKVNMMATTLRERPMALDN